jgi:hypothetical protein
MPLAAPLRDTGFVMKCWNCFSGVPFEVYCPACGAGPTPTAFPAGTIRDEEELLPAEGNPPPQPKAADGVPNAEIANVATKPLRRRETEGGAFRQTPAGPRSGLR